MCAVNSENALSSAACSRKNVQRHDEPDEAAARIFLHCHQSTRVRLSKLAKENGQPLVHGIDCGVVDSSDLVSCSVHHAHFLRDRDVITGLNLLCVDARCRFPVSTNDTNEGRESRDLATGRAGGGQAVGVNRAHV